MLEEAKVAGHRIKEFLSDNGGEFDNDKVRKELDKHGINQRLVMPYTPEQNGTSERENRTIVEMVRALMYAHEELPQVLWAELVKTAVYILNRTGPTSVEGKSPFELWFEKKPQIKHLRIIGSTCYVHIPKQNRKKMQKKAQKCILIGYDNDDGYRLWNKQSNSLVRSRDVTFDERPIKSKIDAVDSEIRKEVTEVEVPLYIRKETPTPVVEVNEDAPMERHSDHDLDENHDTSGAPFSSDDVEFEDALPELPEQDESIELGEENEENCDEEHVIENNDNEGV